MSKIIVITGAGVGLGRALARRCAEAGDTCILLGRTFSKVEAVAQELGGDALALACDVANPASVREAFAAIKEKFGKIDVLINNAAIFQPTLIEQVEDAVIDLMIDTNLKGTIYCAREALNMMDNGGHIINVSSESVQVPFANLLIYQLSKAAVERFTEGLIEEVAHRGIRVTAVRCGQMMEAGKVWEVEAETAMAFAQANAARGINLRERPISQFASTLDAFRAVIDAPADLNIPFISLSARKPAA